jgi:predicted outer membrane repeat protein
MNGGAVTNTGFSVGNTLGATGDFQMDGGAIYSTGDFYVGHGAVNGARSQPSR